MDDFERRLASRLAVYEQSAPAPDAPSRPVARQRRGLLLAPIAGVVVIGVVFGLVSSGLLTGVRPTGPSPATSPSTSTTPAPAATLAWQVHRFKPGAILRAITAVDGRLILTGATNAAAAWYSDDGGETWINARVETTGVQQPASLGPVAAAKGRLVSLGSVANSPIGPDADVRGAIWISPDGGATWQVGPKNAPAITGAIASGGPGFVAVGQRFGATAAEVWTSPDGLGWTQAPADPTFEHAVFSAIASSAQGLTAVGYRLTDPADPSSQQPAAWFSTDGLHWTAASLGTETGVVIDVAADLSAGFIASGYRTDLSPVVWRSSNGRDWQSEPMPAPWIAGSIATGPLGTVITGDPGAPAQRGTARVWFLPNGQQEQSSADLDLWFGDLAALPDRFVATANCGPTADCAADMIVIGKPPAAPQPSPTPSSSSWSRRPFPEPTAFINDMLVADGHIVAVGGDKSGPAAWTSNDGLTWNRSKVDPGSQDFPGGKGAGLGSVAANGNHLLSLGSKMASTGRTASTSLWESNDGGLSWTASQHQVPGFANGLANVGSGWVAVGQSAAGGAAAWTSADGSTWNDARTDSSFSQAAMGAISSRNGLLVAVGEHRSGNTSSQPSVWASHDGSTWSATSLGSNADGGLNAVIGTDDGFIVSGEIVSPGATGAAIWRSIDGISWTLAGVQPETKNFTEVAVSGGAVVAIGGPRNGDESTGYAESRQGWLLQQSADIVRVPELDGTSQITAFENGFVAIAGCGGINTGCHDASVIVGQPAPFSTVRPSPNSPQPAQKSSTWTRAIPPSASGPTSPIGGPGGGLAALPGGGFIDFVVNTPDRSQVFTSADGVTWREIGSVTGSDANGITGPVASNGHVFVALGSESGVVAYGPQSNGAAWVSSDLRIWTKAPVQSALGGIAFRDIAGGPEGFVAIGFNQGGQAVWTSVDGLHWTTVTDKQVFPPADTEPTAIRHTSHGFLMVGRIADQATVWTSVDGRHWTLHSPLPGGSGVVLDGLADGPEGLVTLGSGGPRVEVGPDDIRAPVASWISSTGESWQVQAPSPALFGAQAFIVGAPGGYFAAGLVGTNLEPQLWTSTNGAEWVPVAGVDLSSVLSFQLVSDDQHVLLYGTGKNAPLLLVTSAASLP